MNEPLMYAIVICIIVGASISLDTLNGLDIPEFVKIFLEAYKVISTVLLIPLIGLFILTFAILAPLGVPFFGIIYLCTRTKPSRIKGPQ